MNATEISSAILAIQAGSKETLDRMAKPFAIPLVENLSTSGNIFENAIRSVGVRSACEWFGQRDSLFERDTVICLLERSLDDLKWR